MHKKQIANPFDTKQVELYKYGSENNENITNHRKKTVRKRQSI